jgi:16S rRNA U516 pseudouridylate synthase RsuA-like enzyme
MRLQRLVREWPVEFSVRARGALEPLRQQSLLRGELDDGTVVRIEALQAGAAEGEGSNQWHHVLTRGASGKAVRQLFERQGLVVSRVLRTSLGPLRLTRELGRGHFRNLDAEEGRALDAALAGEPVPVASSHVAPPPALLDDEADFEVPARAQPRKPAPRARPTGRRSSRP